MSRRFVLTLTFVIWILSIGNPMMGDKPCRAQAVAVAPGVGTAGETSPANWHHEWTNATPEQRLQIAEEIGEEGARMFAEKRGYQPIFDGKGRILRQGPDQVYLDPRTGEIVVIEAKGGTSPLGRGYGYEQGTRAWAVKSAEQVLHSPNASSGERKAAVEIICAARQGKLRVEVVRTSHVLGRPGAAVLEKVAADSVDEAAGIALEIARKFESAPTASPSQTGSTAAAISKGLEAAPKGMTIPREGCSPRSSVVTSERAIARGAAVEGSAIRGMAKVAAPVAIAADAGLRIWESTEVENAYQRGEITRQQRNLEHTKNVAGCIGGWAGAWAGGEAGASAGAAIGTAVCPGIGTAIGGLVGGIVGSVGGYFAGEKAAEAGTEAVFGR